LRVLSVKKPSSGGIIEDIFIEECEGHEVGDLLQGRVIELSMGRVERERDRLLPKGCWTLHRGRPNFVFLESHLNKRVDTLLVLKSVVIESLQKEIILFILIQVPSP
jgi:hypothetical protein